MTTDTEDSSCPLCKVDWTQVKDMLFEKAGSDNWECAQKIIANCPACGMHFKEECGE